MLLLPEQSRAGPMTVCFKSSLSDSFENGAQTTQETWVSGQAATFLIPVFMRGLKA